MEVKKRGQPKKEPTDTLSLRVPVSLKKDLQLTFGRRLNKIVNKLLLGLLKKD